MAEVALVDEHTNGCTVCQAVAGPFVVFAVSEFTVQTASMGPLGVAAELVFCAPRDGREGCAGQMARTVGYVPPDEHRLALTQYADVLESHETLEQRVGELEQAQSIREEELAAKIAKKVIEEASAA